jgi:Alr-MurF fusion protein
MVSYTADSVADIVKGTFAAKGNSELILQLLTDSRKISSTEGVLFFALKGDRHNGHNYIKDLYSRGIRNFIISEDIPEIQQFPEANFIKVSSALKALQDLAAYHRKCFSLPVTAVTGSNGKTIIKEWLYQLLREDFNIVRSPKSYNSQVGVPLSVWQIKEEHNLGIFEAGISLPGEMETLEKIIQPQTGIFINIGEAHAENFPSLEEKVKEKAKLFISCQNIIYCRDYLPVETNLKALAASTGAGLFSWSGKRNADLQIGRVTKINHETEIQGVYKLNFIKIKIPFTDEASIENAITCWAWMLFNGYENSVIAKRMLLLSPVAMRLEMKEGINNCSIINDSYNSDLGSLSIALDFLNQQTRHEKKTLILSDILQSGKDESKLYSEVAQMVAGKGVKRIIGIGEAISRQADKFLIEKHFYSDTAQFLKQISPENFRDETILLKGARAFGFEQISKLLQQKAHQTVLEINLDAVIHNLNYFKSKLKPGTGIMAMVKAFSYGTGSFEIANILQFHRVDYLAVAYADEGVELRKSGITAPIMVMNPEEQSYDTMIKYRLEPEIYSFRILNKFEETLKINSDKITEPFPIHLKVDTGMKRLGFEKHEINELVVRIKNNKSLKVRTVFSHLSASEDPSHDEFTRLQIAAFKEMSERIVKYLDYPVMLHILNSSGIIRFPDAQFNMVRVGIGLYGIGTNEYEQNRLQNVSTLKTLISQVKSLSKGETVGYGRSFAAPKEMRIATIPIGYADGLSRRLGNGKGKVFIGGKPAPIIGNVCMDMCMIDVSGISAKEGDEVIIFGEDYPITEFAKDLDTIPYEALTMVSRRVKRVYYHE